ncbi:hypothetical protein PRK78_000941 [Emydomyces testavorans]|uniref:DUF1742-domain-containing protein n=1 Tax=Emydomyces testavorans TaxID=2070801 RepID=A0AAF0IEY8_9EURO|nr:hypothetical protein PRK78_000941 [Emydomyces testavorans]
MSQPLIPNRWHLRRVAGSAARACLICYKPSSSVLITPDNKDFFYICPLHLKDKGFCSPIVDEEEVAARRKKEEMEKEIEKVTREYEEKMKRKKEKGKGKQKDKDKDEKDEKGKKQDNEDEEKAEKEKDDKIKAIRAGSAGESTGEEAPRIYALHKSYGNGEKESPTDERCVVLSLSAKGRSLALLQSIIWTTMSTTKLRQGSKYPGLPRNSTVEYDAMYDGSGRLVLCAQLRTHGTDLGNRAQVSNTYLAQLAMTRYRVSNSSWSGSFLTIKH